MADRVKNLSLATFTLFEGLQVEDLNVIFTFPALMKRAKAASTLELHGCR
jgi:hypothetical protein